jgi:hypothetical protein
VVQLLPLRASELLVYLITLVHPGVNFVLNVEILWRTHQDGFGHTLQV